MKIRDRLLQAVRRLYHRLKDSFEQGTGKKILDVRQEILEQVQSRITDQGGEKIFPYQRLFIQLNPTTPSLHESFHRLFIEHDSLRADIRRLLTDAQVNHPENLQIAVRLLPVPRKGEVHLSGYALFHLEFERMDPVPGREIPEARLIVTRGAAEQPEYRTRKGRILIGSAREVLDREGRVVRRNDLVFIDNGDEINSTVGRVHARIYFDRQMQEFYVMDEVSRYGTRIVREGRSIEVPSGDLRGIALRSNDEIYIGLASVRFELPGDKSSSF